MGSLSNRLAATLFLITFSTCAVAAPSAVVEGLQMPAWVERGGKVQAARVGMGLQSRDVLRTGRDARVLVRLQEGSAVKLGADAELVLATLQPPASSTSAFTSVLNVLKGAFRFTTSALGKTKRRNITARVATVTIGIRGTDVWGKAEPERDFVVLIEGEISIERDGERLTMSEPQTLFMAPAGQAALPVSPVDPDDLAGWAQETELQAGEGVISNSGNWRLNLASYRDSSYGSTRLAQLNEAGYAAELQSVEIDGQQWTRLAIEALASRADALTLKADLAATFGFRSAWAVQQ